MKITTKSYYATKAILYLAERPPQAVTTIRDIANARGLPEKYLEEIMLRLKQAGIVRSRQGIRGGYTLARPAEQTTLGDVIRTMDGPLAPVPCASLTAPARCHWCHDEQACELRPIWQKVRDAVAGVLDNTTLAEVVRRRHTIRQQGEALTYVI